MRAHMQTPAYPVPVVDGDDGSIVAWPALCRRRRRRRRLLRVLRVLHYVVEPH